MNLKVRKIAEDEFAKFLLNPFEKAATFKKMIIQKYPINREMDDILCFPEESKDFYRLGVIFYKKGEIVLELPDLLQTKVMKSAPFIKTYELKDRIKGLVEKRLEETKIKKLDEIKEGHKFKNLYGYSKDRFFESIVFYELGTTNVSFNTKSYTMNSISRFISGLKIDDLIGITLGSMEKIDEFIAELMESNNFIETEIVQHEIIEDAKAYVAAGKFNKREQLLIHYLKKTKASGAQRFTVETLTGRKSLCKNEVNHLGKVFSVDGLSFIVDIEEIKTVKYRNKIIYKKATL